MPAYNPGALVLYHAKSATVTAVNKEKIEIRIEGGDTKSVRPKDIEFLHPGPVRSLPPAALPAPDAQELSALMEGETLPFGDFAELAYGTRSPEAYYSAWMLLQEGIYFTGSIETGVTARSQEEIAESLAALREKEARQLRRAELLERIRGGALLPEDLPAMREIEQVALGETASSRLLRELGIEAVPPKAHELLLKLGVWDLFVDPWPARMGVNLETPEIELGALPPEPRTDLTHLAALAIDDEGSNDPDDAISYEDGVLWVHVADPAALVTPGSPADDEAMNRGVTLFDTAIIYSPLNNEELAGEALGEFRGKVNVTTKFGHEVIDGKATGRQDSSPATIRRYCEESLKRLRTDVIPMFYQHRFDPNTPVEDVAGTIADLIREGKVLHWGMCEVSAETIRKAHAVCPLTAIQSEYHLMHRDVEKNGVLDVCREQGIGFVPYSPMNRGFLGGDLNEYTEFDPHNDNRTTLPRFTPEAMRDNYRIVNVLQRFGRERGMTAAQLALGWLLQKEPWIVPIPGTTKLSHLEENLRTLDFTLSAEEWKQLEDAVAAIPVTGDRYNAEQQKQVGF